jgi:hypothetical protein
MSDQIVYGIFRDGDGHFSMMRVISFIGASLGVLCVFVGLPLAVFESLWQTGVHTANGVAITGLGVGCFTSGALAKAWQSQSENKGV